MPPLPKNATTRSPSVTQDAEAQPFMAWLASGVPVHASCSHSTLPLLRSTQNTSRVLPESRAEVRKMRSPQMIGDDCPRPLRGVFQTIEFASHFTGSRDSAEWPVPSGPRQHGQLGSAESVMCTLNTTRVKANVTDRTLQCMEGVLQSWCR